MGPGVLFLGALAAWAASRGSSGEGAGSSGEGAGSSGDTTPRRPNTRRLLAAQPWDYAQSKSTMLRRRIADPAYAAAVVRWGQHFFPGAPAAAIVGLAASSMGAAERVGNESTSGSAVGHFGVEGPRLRQWSADSITRADLGRTVAVSGQAWTEDTEGQVYLGLRSYRAHLDAVRQVAGCAPATGPTDQWTMLCAAAAYSCGPGAVREWVYLLRGDGDAADNAAERVTRAASVRAAIAAAAHGDAGARQPRRMRLRGRYGVAYAMVRADQRLASGAAVAVAAVAEAADDDARAAAERAAAWWTDTPWLPTAPDAARELETYLVAVAYGAPSSTA